MKSFPHNILSDLELIFSKIEKSSVDKSVHIVGAQSPVALASILGSPDYIDLHKKTSGCRGSN